MTTTDPTVATFTISSFEAAKEVYRQKDLRQALYDEGEVVMGDVLVNLHGDEHRKRRRVENRIFRRETFDHYERDLFPQVTEVTVAPYVAAGGVDLVQLGHELMLNLAALTAGIDRPEGTAEETRRLYDYMQWFIKGATLAHSTEDKPALAARIQQALEEWDEEFLKPSVARRKTALAALEAGEITENDLPRDILTTLLRSNDELALPAFALRREIAFFLLASAHTSATAFVRSIDHILGWLADHPEDAERVTGDPMFVQRCVHETVRLNPSSPVGMRWALAPVSLKSGTEIPQGSKVVIDLHAVNRDPEVFGPDAAEFNPYRELPAGVGPFGLSFAAGIHVCIGQDLAAGVVPRADTAPEEHLFGLVPGAVRYMFNQGVRRDPADPPRRDAQTQRPYWGTYPALLG
ncbi:cytochrome P450 [Streptosporangium amethystogenes subsp. fukuiense]|uniref:Cytochrome P450 n=1 Tax=Streptosporangium amethystogenes subsp. fukuiense TaxID=698418 RepID=A0ABW2TBL2_9ACTN